jgi:thioredoxin-dependent peroxiredoxin
MLRIGDVAPDFTAETTQGAIRFHDWIGDGWAVLFSHPKDFTPVCTTELGFMAGLEPEFAKRGCKIIGLSVDPVEAHQRWKVDIEETQGHAVHYPMIGDESCPASRTKRRKRSFHTAGKRPSRICASCRTPDERGCFWGLGRRF